MRDNAYSVPRLTIIDTVDAGVRRQPHREHLHDSAVKGGPAENGVRRRLLYGTDGVGIAPGSSTTGGGHHRTLCGIETGALQRAKRIIALSLSKKRAPRPNRGARV